MNYFPFHLGDYAAHTAHLELLEDIAYRRMLDAYYLREGPLPADAKEVARVIRMKKNLTEVEAVLQEFFCLTDDGWRQERCDLEIVKMREKQETLSEKDQHEKDRMQRYRERRSAMFEALRAKEIVPAWDVAMKDLQRLFDTHCNGPATDLQRCNSVTGNENATAIPTPTPTPTPNKEYSPALRVPSADAVDDSKPLVVKDLIAEGVDPQVAADWLKVRKAKKAPLTKTAWDGVKREAALAGMTPAQAVKSATENGWQGFKASWLHGKNGAAGQHQAGNDWTGSAL